MYDCAVIRVLIVDDHPIWADGLSRILDDEPCVRVVGVASNGQEGVELARNAHPDVVVLDAHLPGQSGAITARALRKLMPDVGILAMSAHDDDETVFSMLGAGAAGYLLKDAEPEEVVSAVQEVARGETPLTPAVARKVVNAVSNGVPDLATAGSQVGELTRRELELLPLLVAGLSNRDIAAELCLSERTVENHLYKIFRKLGVHDRTQAATHAVRSGWVIPRLP